MSQTERELYIGLMSGTSLDSIDAVIADLSGRATLVGHREIAIPPTLRETLLKLCLGEAQQEIELMGQADRELGCLLAAATLELLKEYNLTPAEIRAIGSHGQTIRHRPKLESGFGFTLQIGDPNTLAELTQITTVADFRRRDLALGGEGAPLAPLFHEQVFSHPERRRAIANIGGMANITLLIPQEVTRGYDTGPGNVLIDSWCQLKQGQAYDKNGAWAASGNVNPELLSRLLAHPYFSTPPPKSTGRESFHLEWLNSQLQHVETVSDRDVQATLTELTAVSLANELSHIGVDEVFCCGGGAYNRQLMQRLQHHLPTAEVSDTSTLGVPPEWVEGVMFAWLAQQTLSNVALNTPPVTGASRPSILGGIYPGY